MCIERHFWNGRVRTTKISNVKARRMVAKKKKKKSTFSEFENERLTSNQRSIQEEQLGLSKNS